MEEWRDIKGYEGYYQVSNTGKVKSLDRISGGKNFKGKSLKMNNDTCGYPSLILYGKEKKRFTVHSLVAQAFLGHTINGMNGSIVDHIDNNKQNNNIDNLQLTTQRYNSSKNRKNKSSKFVGVSFNKKRNNWYSQIRIGKKKIGLGTFSKEIDAHKAYQEALKSYSRN